MSEIKETAAFLIEHFEKIMASITGILVAVANIYNMHLKKTRDRLFRQLDQTKSVEENRAAIKQLSDEIKALADSVNKLDSND